MTVKFLEDESRVITPKKAPLLIHVNGHNIRDNRNHRLNNPVITVRYGRGNVAQYCHHLEITGPSRVVYGKALSCGAEVWIETNSEVICK